MLMIMMRLSCAARCKPPPVDLYPATDRLTDGGQTKHSPVDHKLRASLFSTSSPARIHSFIHSFGFERDREEVNLSSAFCVAAFVAAAADRRSGCPLFAEQGSPNVTGVNLESIPTPVAPESKHRIERTTTTSLFLIRRRRPEQSFYARYVAAPKWPVAGDNWPGFFFWFPSTSTPTLTRKTVANHDLRPQDLLPPLLANYTIMSTGRGFKLARGN